MTKTLHFRDIKFNYPELTFVYSYNDFSYTVSLPLKEVDKNIFDDLDQKLLYYLFFHIGISLSPYLFNIEDFDEVVVHPYGLDNFAKNFFSDYLQKGLGEFRYRNNLNPSKKIVFINGDDAEIYKKVLSEKMKERILLMCGGGKDSVVAGKIVEDLGVDFSWLLVNPNRHRVELAEKINNSMLFSGKLERDPNINKHSKYKGHKPLSAYLAFTSVLFACLYNYKYICVGNEQSANFGNVLVDEFVVNHQYTKSFDFEKKFFNYVRKKISKDIYYFSPLRPVYDLQLGKIFSQFKEFHTTFVSCNDNQHESSWCGVCAKCAFTFLIMYPFISEEESISIFGSNFFDNKTTRDWIKEMCISEARPFECIGTKDECRYALYLCLNKAGNTLREKPYYDQLASYVGNLDLQKASEEYLQNYKNENNIPSSMKENIFNFYSRYL